MGHPVGKTRSFLVKAAAFSALLVFGSERAQAESNWDYTAFIYLWGASIGGETVTGEDVDVSFSDIVDNLDFGIMGTVEARNGPWSIFADGLYLNVSDDDDAAVGPGIPASSDVDVKGFVFAPGIGYDLIDNGQTRLVGFGKLRYVDMDTTANIAVGPGSQRLKDDFSNWDGVVGLRGIHALSEKWDFIWLGDVGTGDTDLTWQAAVAFEYKLETWSLVGGYRHLAWEDLNDSKTLKDLDFSGPFFGAKIEF